MLWRWKSLVHKVPVVWPLVCLRFTMGFNFNTGCLLVLQCLWYLEIKQYEFAVHFLSCHLWVFGVGNSGVWKFTSSSLFSSSLSFVMLTVDCGSTSCIWLTGLLTWLFSSWAYILLEVCQLTYNSIQFWKEKWMFILTSSLVLTSIVSCACVGVVVVVALSVVRLLCLLRSFLFLGLLTPSCCWSSSWPGVLLVRSWKHWDNSFQLRYENRGLL